MSVSVNNHCHFGVLAREGTRAICEIYGYKNAMHDCQNYYWRSYVSQCSADRPEFAGRHARQ